MNLKPCFHWIPSKAEEEKGVGSGRFPLQSIRCDLVDVREDSNMPLDLMKQWEIRKTLAPVDIGSLGGLVLDPVPVYNNIFRYWNHQLVLSLIERGQQIPIIIRDLDTKSEHSLFIKKSTIDESFIISTFWVRDFVHRRDLKEGDMIGMYWHPRTNSFCFSVLKRAGVE